MAKKGEKLPYTRKPFDAERMCGAPVNRDPVALREHIEKYQRKWDDVDEIGKSRELTIIEKKSMGRWGRMMTFKKKALQKIEEQGPDDRPCVKMKGQATDHPGVGLCMFHCECKGREGAHMSYYSRKAKDKKLQELIDEMEQSNSDILDLTPDVIMLRAKMKLFLDDRVDFDPETVRSLALIADQLRKNIETINDKRFKASITVETFNLLQYRMAEVLMKYVQDGDTLEKIASDWTRISVETNMKKNRAQIAGASGSGE